MVEEKADLREDKLFVTAENATFPLLPAVHFKKLVSGSDVHQLVDKVKTREQLDALSAEQLSDSVLIGEDAYEIDPGYVTDVVIPVTKKGSSEADMLAEFFLNKLS